MGRPDPEDYPTAGQWLWARHLWRRRHGGSMIGNVGVAILAGAITGSVWGIVAFVGLAVAVTLARRHTEPPST